MSSRSRPGSLRGYARHRAERGLPGQTLGAVQRAIREARITVDAEGQLPDYANADRQWAANTIPPYMTGKHPGPTREDDPGSTSAPEDDQGAVVRVADALAVWRRHELAFVEILGDAMREVAPKVARETDPAKIAEMLERAVECAHEALEVQWRRWYGEPPF